MVMFGRFSTSAASLLPRPCFRPLFWQLGLMYAVKPKEIFRRVEQPAVIQRPCEMTGRSLPSGAGAKVQGLWLDQGRYIRWMSNPRECAASTGVQGIDRHGGRRATSAGRFIAAFGVDRLWTR